MSKEDFASLMEASVKAGKGTGRRLKNGEVLEGTVVQISGDSVFVDVGATKEARVPRLELEDKDGNMRVKVGDKLKATVVDHNADSPLLAIALGRGGIDLGQLETARDSGAPVSGRVTKAVKGGLEVDVGGVRAFCPASQVEIGYAADLAPYEGQTFEFRVLEIKDGGRSVVLSRRSLLEDERRAKEVSVLETLVVGADLDGTVSSVSRHGAQVDIGGLDGFVHISELSHQRVERTEDVVNTGDRVSVRVLAIEQSDKGPRVRLSMRARASAPEAPVVQVDEVLAAVVVKATGGGVIVSTTKGEGMIPHNELGLPPGSDHRRAYPAGRELQVVVVSRDASRGRLRFSAVGVARVEERKNYRDFAGATGPGGRSLGSLGDLLRKKLGLPDAEPEPAVTKEPEAAPQQAQPGMAAFVAADPPKRDEPRAGASAPTSERRPDPEGVIRRKR
ncbi:MAG: S1 RNA-binding domain-containing protein [Myxococcales bacterium]|nr:S1 RNA-binding domain-containing protein [Myxococcales bacterium]